MFSWLRGSIQTIREFVRLWLPASLYRLHTPQGSTEVPVGEKKEGKNPLFKYIKCDINVLSIEDACELCVSQPFYVLLHEHHE